MSLGARECRTAALAALLASCSAPESPFGAAPTEPVDLRGEISADEVPLLGEVALRLDLYVGDGVEVAFDPTVPEGFAGRVEAVAPRPLGAGEWRQWRLTLRPGKVGEVTIPSFRAETTDGAVATSRDWTVHVTTVLDGAGAEVEAPAPAFLPAADLVPWILGAGAVAAVGVLVWWLRRRRKARPAVGETALPAHVTALRALGRLRNAPRSTPPQVDQFYVEVSDVLRRYLEERFGLRAPERTTEEFLAELRTGDALGVEHRQGIAQFLQQCDLVKFARAFPGEDVHSRIFAVAEQFVDATREDRVREGVA